MVWGTFFLSVFIQRVQITALNVAVNSIILLIAVFFKMNKTCTGRITFLVSLFYLCFLFEVTLPRFPRELVLEKSTVMLVVLACFFLAKTSSQSLRRAWTTLHNFSVITLLVKLYILLISLLCSLFAYSFCYIKQLSLVEWIPATLACLPLEHFCVSFLRTVSYSSFYVLLTNKAYSFSCVSFFEFQK